MRQTHVDECDEVPSSVRIWPLPLLFPFFFLSEDLVGTSHLRAGASDKKEGHRAPTDVHFVDFFKWLCSSIGFLGQESTDNWQPHTFSIQFVTTFNSVLNSYLHP